MPRSITVQRLSIGAVATALCFCVPAAAAAQRSAAPYYPGPHGDWERWAPAQVGMDGGRLDDAIAFAVANEAQAPRDLERMITQGYTSREPYPDALGPFKPRGDMTGIIIRHGYVVATWGQPDRVDMTFSVTKSFLSSAVGLAFDRGLIRSVHDTVYRSVPIDEFRSPHNRTVTWDHLLRQTSDWQGTLWDKPDWGDRPPPGVPVMELMNRPRHPPGTSYKYNDVRVNALALAALHVWRRPLPQILREYVMDPIGASPMWRWHGYENSWVTIDGLRMQSVSGGGHWGGGMWISAWDLARFGLMTLRNGRWKERQILSEAWVKMARTPTAVEPGYGFMNWFLNTGREMYPAAPESAWAHRGGGDNIIYCDPENDLVIVVRWIERPATPEFIRRVLAAVR